MRVVHEIGLASLRRLASRCLLLILTLVIGGLPSVAVQGFAWVSMIVKDPQKSIVEAAFSSPPCRYCDLARAIQPDQEPGNAPTCVEKGTILLGPVNSVVEQKEPPSLPVIRRFGSRPPQSLRNLLAEAPRIPPPEFDFETA